MTSKKIDRHPLIVLWKSLLISMVVVDETLSFYPPGELMAIGDDEQVTQEIYDSLVTKAIADQDGDDGGQEFSLDKFIAKFRSDPFSAQVRAEAVDLLKNSCGGRGTVTHETGAHIHTDHRAEIVKSSYFDQLVKDGIVKGLDEKPDSSLEASYCSSGGGGGGDGPSPLPSSFQLSPCPSDRAMFQPLRVGDSNVKQKYAHFFLHDCNLWINVVQIAKDSERITLVGKSLFEIIMREHVEKGVAALLPPQESSETDAASGGWSSGIAMKTWKSITTPIKAVLENDEKQFLAELAQIVNVCTEVNLIYTIYGRNHPQTTSSKLSPHIPFRYYQGMMDICYFLVLFSRTPKKGATGTDPTANYPAKNRVFNMMATMVEQVSNVPLVSSSLGDYYVNIFKVIEPQVRAHFAPSSAQPEDFQVNIFGRHMLSFFSSAGISNKQNAAEANFEWLPKVWSLVFRHKKAGLFGVFFACYLTILGIRGDMDDVVFHLPNPLVYLHETGKVGVILDLASRILNHKEYVLNSGATGNFTQLLDETIAAFANKYRP